MRKEKEHNEIIVKQFSQQAIPFAQIPGHLASIEKIIKIAHIKAASSVLDIACGPGILSCEFAKHVKSVIGLDITDAMLDEARKRQTLQGLHNINWIKADAISLPFQDKSFDAVVTRYSFHHFIEPDKALKEMLRVCRQNGRVVVADVALPADKTKAYDELEVMRDPSHVHALSLEEFSNMFFNIGLTEIEKAFYSVDLELESQLAASFPADNAKEKLRHIIKNDIGINRLGINARYEKSKIVYSCPILILAGIKK